MATALGELVKVLQKGKITIPAYIRQKLGINEEDDCVTFEIVNYSPLPRRASTSNFC